MVTPAKMAAYYEAYSLDQEPHPLLSETSYMLMWYILVTDCFSYLSSSF